MSTFFYRTNKVQAVFDYAAIARDFTILLVEPKEPDDGSDEHSPFYQNPILDVLVQDAKALASVYTQGRCMAIFPKDSSKFSAILAKLSRRYTAYHIKVLDRASLLSPFVRHRLFGYADRHLLRLLLASVCNYQTKEIQYHNVLGQIYLPMEIKEDKAGYKTCVCLHVSVTAGMYLSLGVTSFRQIDPTNIPKGPLYLIEKDSMRRYLGSRSRIPKEEQAILFCQKSSRFTHNTIPFLDISSRAALHETKVGRFMEFMDMASRRLAPYLTISFVEQPFIRIGDKMKNPPVLEPVSWNFVDLIQSPLSVLTSKLFLEYLQNQYPEYKITPCSEVNPEVPTLLLFHDRRYYRHDKQGKLVEDVSLPYRANLRTQGITLEALCDIFRLKTKKPTMPDKDLRKKQKMWDGTLRPLLAKLQSELRIKEDIQNRRFTVFHPQDYLSEPWTYVLPQKETRQDSANPKKKKTFFHFYELIMDPNTEAIAFRYFNEASEGLSRLEAKMIEDTKAFYDFGKHSLGIRLNYNETLDGFVCPGKAPEMSYMIIRTNSFLLPDYTDMPMADLEHEIPAKELFDAFEQEIAQSSDAIYQAELRGWLEQIAAKQMEQGVTDLSLQLIKDAFKQTKAVVPPSAKKGAEVMPKEKSKPRGMNGIIGTRLNEFIGRITNGHYLFTPKGEKNLQKYLMDGHLLGHACRLSRPVFYKEQLEEMRDGIGYVAGYNTSNGRYTIDRAMIIRVLLPSDRNQMVSDDLLTTYFSQLTVHYVRTGYYTVLPFPFKYLREYARYYNACQNIEVEAEDDEGEEDEENVMDDE